MNRPIAPAAALLVVLTGLLACSGTPRNLDAPGGADPTTVEVTNRNPLAVRIDAVSYQTNHRLGLVETMETRRFELPEAVSPTSLRIFVDPVGSSDTFLSRDLTWTPGDVIEVEVQTNVDLTQVTTR